MMLMCVTTVYLATLVMEQPTTARVVAAGLVAGLAVSSKYNALPIAVVPALACLLSRRCSPPRLVMGLIAPAVGFCIGTPYALIQVPEFLDGLAFEIRHYGVLGHGFATVEPGWPHARAFLGWMLNVAAGLLPTVMGLAGAALLMGRHLGVGLLVLFFPVCFLLLMSSQRVAFFRNMLVMIPFFCILAVWAAERAVGWTTRLAWPARSAKMALAPVLVLIISAQPLALAVADWRDRAGAAPESRILASQWLKETAAAFSDTAIAAELQFPYPVYAARGVTRMPTAEIDPVRLFLDGFDRIVAGPAFDPVRNRELMLTERIFPGQQEAQRIRSNPETRVYVLPYLLAHTTTIRSHVEGDPHYSVAPPTFTDESVMPLFGEDWSCAPKDRSDGSATPSRDDCLIPSRLARIVLDRGAVTTAVARGDDIVVTLDLRTPWPSQSCTLELPGWTSPDICAELEPGRWERRSATVPAGVVSGENPFWIRLAHVHSPSSQSGSEDRRRLGLWVRAVALSAQRGETPQDESGSQLE